MFFCANFQTIKLCVWEDWCLPGWSCSFPLFCCLVSLSQPYVCAFRVCMIGPLKRYNEKENSDMPVLNLDSSSQFLAGKMSLASKQAVKRQPEYINILFMGLGYCNASINWCFDFDTNKKNIYLFFFFLGNKVRNCGKTKVSPNLTWIYRDICWS